MINNISTKNVSFKKLYDGTCDSQRLIYMEKYPQGKNHRANFPAEYYKETLSTLDKLSDLAGCDVYLSMSKFEVPDNPLSKRLDFMAQVHNKKDNSTMGKYLLRSKNQSHGIEKALDKVLAQVARIMVNNK